MQPIIPNFWDQFLQTYKFLKFLHASEFEEQQELHGFELEVHLVAPLLQTTVAQVEGPFLTVLLHQHLHPQPQDQRVRGANVLGELLIPWKTALIF